MFGPDICGTKAVVHAIFNYNGTNYDLQKVVAAEKDTLTHTYTLVVKPDQTYQILIDGEVKGEGSLLEDWKFLPPKKIQDPEAKKPEDWDDDMDGEWEAPSIANPEYQVNGLPRRSPTLSTRANGSILKLTTPSTRSITRSMLTISPMSVLMSGKSSLVPSLTTS